MFGWSSRILDRIEYIKRVYPEISNEEATKQHLILPLLSELGWRVGDPHEVYPEVKTRNSKRPDYTLLIDNKPVVFLEAKSAKTSILRKDNVPVSRYLKQLMNYCFEEGVALGILTNGVQWVLLETFYPWTPPEKRTIQLVDLRITPSETAAKQLMSFSRRSIREYYYRRYGYRLGETGFGF